MRGSVVFDTIVNTILWIIVVLLIGMNVVYVVEFLRKRPRTRRGLVGLLSICLVTLAALCGLIYVQAHNVNAMQSGSYYLFFSALFAEQVIAQWTLNDQMLKSAHVSVRWIWIIFTIFVIVYTIFALVVAIFHL